MPKKAILEAGEVVGTHGVRGELRVQAWCDSAEQFCAMRTLFWDEGATKPVTVTSRPHKNIVLVKAEGVDTVEAAAALRGKILYCRREDLHVPEDRCLIVDLIGLPVVDAETGIQYGTVGDVSEVAGHNAIYHLDTASGEVLMPVIPDIVKEVDVDGGVIRIIPMKGLFNDAD